MDVRDATEEAAEKVATSIEDVKDEDVADEEIEVDPIAYRNNVLEDLSIDTEVNAEFNEAVVEPSKSLQAI